MCIGNIWRMNSDLDYCRESLFICKQVGPLSTSQHRFSLLIGPDACISIVRHVYSKDRYTGAFFLGKGGKGWVRRI